MESTQNDFEASMNITDINRYFRISNTSDFNMPKGTDASGLTDIKERLSEKGMIFGLFEPSEENENYREEFIIEPKEAYFQKGWMDEGSFKPPTKEVTSVNLSLKFSEKIEDLINVNTTFRKLISHIEIGLNNFIEIKNINMTSTIFFEEDWEIPDYEKLVLSLNFKGIPFNKELKLWKLINKIIYEKIKSLILFSSEEDMRKIKDWKKKFFIKLNM